MGDAGRGRHTQQKTALGACEYPRVATAHARRRLPEEMSQHRSRKASNRVSTGLSEVRPAGPPRRCGRGGRCGSGSSGVSGAVLVRGVGTGGGCGFSARGHIGVRQGGGNQGSISAAGCSGRVTDVGGQVTRPRGITRPPRAQTSSPPKAGLAHRGPWGVRAPAARATAPAWKPYPAYQCRRGNEPMPTQR